MTRVPVLAFALVLIAPRLQSQDIVPGPFTRLFAHFYDSLQHDTLIDRLSMRPQGFTLNDLLPNDMLLRLSDSDLVELAAVTAVSLNQLDSTRCAHYAPGGGDFDLDLLGLASRVDSMTAERWMHLFRELVLTGLHDLPRGPVLPLDSALLSLVRMIEGMPPSERALYRAVMTAKVPSKDGRCAFAKAAWRAYANLPPAQAGPMLRAFVATDLPQ